MLILFDGADGFDWKGQRRQVHIYRLLATGTIDEKIFQRQIAKQGLGVAIDAKGGGGAGRESQTGSSEFSKEDLKDLFKLHQDTASDTHDLLDCACSGCTDGQAAAQAAASERDTLASEGGGGHDDGSAGSTGGGGGAAVGKRSKKAKDVGALMSWGHLYNGTGLCDGLLQSVTPASAISFVMHKQTNHATPEVALPAAGDGACGGARGSGAGAGASTDTDCAMEELEEDFSFNAAVAAGRAEANAEVAAAAASEELHTQQEPHEHDHHRQMQHGRGDAGGGVVVDEEEEEEEEELVDLLSVFSDSD